MTADVFVDLFTAVRRELKEVSPPPKQEATSPAPKFDSQTGQPL